MLFVGAFALGGIATVVVGLAALLLWLSRNTYL